jgi:threonine dehydrogenase-like Zn-dependent dehydrogenase
MQMQKALVLRENGAKVEEIPIPEIPKDCVLVRVLLSGVCGTDLQLLAGYYGGQDNLVTGHEFVGRVVSTNCSEWTGKRIVADITVSCELNKCRMCQCGRNHHCLCRQVIGIKQWNGAHAEFVVVPIRNLVMVPDSICDEAAVFAEPIAAAMEIVEQIHVKPTLKCLVIGCGRLGQLICRVLMNAGVELSCIVKSEAQAKILKLASKSCRIIMLENLDPLELQDRFDIVVEASGSADGINQAIDFVMPQGTIVAKSTTSQRSNVDLSKVVVKEISIIGSRCGPLSAAIRFLENKSVDPLPLISKIIPFSEVQFAFEYAAKKENIKVLIDHRIE